MDMLKRSLMAFAATVAVTAPLPILAADVTLRLHQFLPAQAVVPKNVLVPWMERIMAESDGRVEIQHFPTMQLGGTPPGLYDQARDGVADIVWTLPGYTPGRFPHSEVFELPFMMTDSNAEATSRAFWDIAEKYMFDADFKDVKVLGAWVHSPGLIHSSELITSPSELAGVKLRAPTRVTNMMFSSIGATAVGMPVPAVPEALSKGVIDATVIPWEVTVPLKVPELVSYHLEFGDASLYTATFVLAMNRDAYDGLPDDLKAVIDANSGADLSAMAGREMQIGDAPGRAMAEELGNTITTLTPEQVEEWRIAASGTIDAWIAEVAELGLDGAALVEEARALIEKHTAAQ